MQGHSRHICCFAPLSLANSDFYSFEIWWRYFWDAVVKTIFLASLSLDWLQAFLLESQLSSFSKQIASEVPGEYLGVFLLKRQSMNTWTISDHQHAFLFLCFCHPLLVLSLSQRGFSFGSLSGFQALAHLWLYSSDQFFQYYYLPQMGPLRNLVYAAWNVAS